MAEVRCYTDIDKGSVHVCIGLFCVKGANKRGGEVVFV